MRQQRTAGSVSSSSGAAAVAVIRGTASSQGTPLRDAPAGAAAASEASRGAGSQKSRARGGARGDGGGSGGGMERGPATPEEGIDECMRAVLLLVQQQQQLGQGAVSTSVSGSSGSVSSPELVLMVHRINM